jgi:hypothetical protein
MAVPKINTNTLRQEFFFTYGLKIIIGERSMSLTQAKGVHDRTFSLTAYTGDSAFDIKETLNPQGNPTCNKRLNDLLSFRKLLLIYRLIHYDDPPVDIQTGLKRRNRELVKPLLQLFHSVEAQIRQEITPTLEYFLKAKQGKKENTIEAALCPIIKELVLENNRILASSIWGIIKEGNRIHGYYDERRPNEFQTEDFGTIYQNTITIIICDKFGAVKKHTENGSLLIFDQQKLLKVCDSYTETKIQLTENPDDPDGSDGSRQTPAPSRENPDAEITMEAQNLTDISEKDSGTDVNITTGKIENPSAGRVEPSEPSEPSANSDKHGSQLSDNTPAQKPFMPIVSVEDFFSSKQPLPLPDHSLEQSPCYPIIGSKPGGNYIMYHCKIHPKVKNTNLESIEHHCRFADPNHHKEEIMKSFQNH